MPIITVMMVEPCTEVVPQEEEEADVVLFVLVACIEQAAHETEGEAQVQRHELEIPLP